MIGIAEQFKNELIEHARQAAPQEVCGLLAGRGDNVERVYKMANTSDTPELCYFMDPKEQLKFTQEIRQLGHELVGIYHSHPASQAYPSGKDVELAFYPEAAYIIISLKDPAQPEINAYRIVDGKITKEEIKII